MLVKILCLSHGIFPPYLNLDGCLLSKLWRKLRTPFLKSLVDIMAHQRLSKITVISLSRHLWSWIMMGKLWPSPMAITGQENEDIQWSQILTSYSMMEVHTTLKGECESIWRILSKLFEAMRLLCHQGGYHTFIVSLRCLHQTTCLQLDSGLASDLEYESE